MLFLLLAGLKFVTAQGNPEKISDARRTFFWTLIGALLVLGAKAIAEVVQNTAKQLQGLYEFGIPAIGYLKTTQVGKILDKYNK